MSVSSAWAERRGMIWPSDENVRQGATQGGLWGVMSVYPTFADILSGLASEGLASIVRILVELNLSAGPDAFTSGWNDYVREYRKCHANWENPGQFNGRFATPGGEGSRRERLCREHALRYVRYKYEPTMHTNIDRPREETWGYSEAQTADTISGPALEAVKGAWVKGGQAVARSTRRDATQGMGIVPKRSGIPRTTFLPATDSDDSTPDTTPTPKEDLQRELVPTWAYWIGAGVGLILLTR